MNFFLLSKNPSFFYAWGKKSMDFSTFRPTFALLDLPHHLSWRFLAKKVVKKTTYGAVRSCRLNTWKKPVDSVKSIDDLNTLFKKKVESRAGSFFRSRKEKEGTVSQGVSETGMLE